jgi:hypothetical protein
MRFACWITQATQTRTYCTMLLAFLRQQWLRERASVFRCTYIAWLVSSVLQIVTWGRLQSVCQSSCYQYSYAICVSRHVAGTHMLSVSVVMLPVLICYLCQSCCQYSYAICVSRHVTSTHMLISTSPNVTVRWLTPLLRMQDIQGYGLVYPNVLLSPVPSGKFQNSTSN